MSETKKNGISRRQFARRAALFSATASIVPAASVFADPSMLTPAQETPAAHPKLSAESQAEADARYQQIMSQYGSRFTAEEKTMMQQGNLMLQESLDHVRAFTLENGDGPALYLKPLVEREKKKPESPASTPAKKS
jgi:hypothetical protein